jgi:hypothetical protein
MHDRNGGRRLASQFPQIRAMLDEFLFGNGLQDEEWMIAGFSIACSPLLGC